MYKIDANNNIWWKVKHYNINNEYTHYTFKIIDSLQGLENIFILKNNRYNIYI